MTKKSVILSRILIIMYLIALGNSFKMMILIPDEIVGNLLDIKVMAQIKDNPLNQPSFLPQNMVKKVITEVVELRRIIQIVST